MSKISFSELKKELGITDVISYPVTSANSIYLLQQGDEVVYVGISDYFGVYARFKSHKVDKAFDTYSIMQTDLDRYHLELLEKGLISLLRPKFNTVHNRFKPEAHQFALTYLKNNTKFLSHDVFVVEKVVERQVERVVEIEKIVEIKTPELPPIIKTIEKIVEVKVVETVEIEVDKYERSENFKAIRCAIETVVGGVRTRYATSVFVASFFILLSLNIQTAFLVIIFASISIGILVDLYPEFNKDKHRLLIVYKAYTLFVSIALVVVSFSILCANIFNQNK